MPNETLPKAKKSWFENVKSEFKKIVWTDKKTLTKQTITVVVITAIMCVIIALVDTGALAVLNLLVK